MEGPIVYVYMSDSAQGEKHPFWSEIYSQPKVAAAHYMAFEEGDRDHYAAQPQRIFWVQAAVRFDQPEVVQDEQGNFQDPSPPVNVQITPEAVPSDSISPTSTPSSSLDGHTDEADL